MLLFQAHCFVPSSWSFFAIGAMCRYKKDLITLLKCVIAKKPCKYPAAILYPVSPLPFPFSKYIKEYFLSY